MIFGCRHSNRFLTKFIQFLLFNIHPIINAVPLFIKSLSHHYQNNRMLLLNNLWRIVSSYHKLQLWTLINQFSHFCFCQFLRQYTQVTPYFIHHQTDCKLILINQLKSSHRCFYQVTETFMIFFYALTDWLSQTSNMIKFWKWGCYLSKKLN